MVDKVETELVVSCMNYNTMLKFLRQRYGDISFILDRYEHSEDFISDPNNWISWGSARRLIFLIKEFLNDYDPRRFYKIGLDWPRLRSVGVFEQLIRLFPSPRSVVARVPELNKRLNHIFEIEVSNLTKNIAEMIIRYRSDFRDSYIYDMCLWNQAAIASIPFLWDLPKMEIRESDCLFTIDEIVNDSYAYLGINSEFDDGGFYVDGREIARRVSKGNAGTVPYVATEDLVVDGIRILKRGTVYGAPYCRYELSWENKSFLKNLHDLTVAPILSYIDSRRALKEQFEYTETQFLEIQRLNKELQAYAENLERLVEERTAQLVEAEKLAAVGQLSFGVGHDLRNTLATAINSGIPLRRLMADLQLLTGMLAEGKPTEEIAEYLRRRKIPSRLANAPGLYETMMSSLAQALDNVKALEGYAVQDGSDFQDVSIEDVIQRVLHDYEEELEGTRMETSFEEREYAFKGNPLKLYDIYQNLVANAIEVMEETEDPILRITTQIGEGVHVTTVEDNGCGMSEEVRRHVFEPFYTTRGLAEGRQRGLGLFNVWRLVEQHSGTIEIESEPEEYTRFYIHFEVAA